MQDPQNELDRTRTTLINRLKNWQDQAGWQEFFDTYWKLIFGVAVKSGLNATEAQEVVQDTMISVAKHMPEFKYDRNRGSFKAWLLIMTRWRITDQFRKRNGLANPQAQTDPNPDSSTATVALDFVSDRTNPELDAIWDAEWEKALLEAALSKVKRGYDPQHYQIFDLYVNKGWTPERIAKAYGNSLNLIYLTKHRISEAIKQEIDRLRNSML